MTITASKVLAFVAAMIFLLATFGVSVAGLAMIPLALFFVAAAMVL